MMDRNLRLSNIDKLVSSALKEREEREYQFIKKLPYQARPHATAVAAIVLSGQPKLDEPLINAWERALQCYAINVGWPGEMEHQVQAAQQLLPRIIGDEEVSARFTEIFRTAPVWLLQFTLISIDASLLKFRLPDISRRLRWGSTGYRDARRWPLLPTGMMTAGDPIPDNDPRRLWLNLSCTVLEGDPIAAFGKRLFRKEKENLFERDNDPFKEDILLALDLDGKPEEEWSSYERRRMRRLSKWLSR
jgi:hypothetical protein